jgi:hypothetical protein
MCENTEPSPRASCSHTSYRLLQRLLRLGGRLLGLKRHIPRVLRRPCDAGTASSVNIQGSRREGTLRQASSPMLLAYCSLASAEARSAAVAASIECVTTSSSFLASIGTAVGEGDAAVFHRTTTKTKDQHMRAQATASSCAGYRPQFSNVRSSGVRTGKA